MGNTLKSNKRQFVFLLIGVVALLILVIGASFAYYGSQESINYSTINASVNAESVGIISLTTGNNISLSLTNSQMSDSGADIIYYGTASGTQIAQNMASVTKTAIGTATTIGNGTFNCAYTMIVNDNANSLYDAYQSNANSNKGAGQVILSINNTDYDFSTANLFPLTYTGSLNGIVEGSPKNITATIKFVNKTGLNQSALAGSSITLTFNVNQFNCNMV